ncbi:uncharacterized protein LACBIDRAFT_332123 [Laccaria bicolor S238N-H82]|uniref:Predicted protein n=1 Tax=Laccaria bicolor (strain S238N-H82 / ATCC MYA-4686) TaxID=486041 RepID=B0DRN5_LACBS|nr:uncharacterized protein LACBIDRAFT_332123 [Laccaria bicolor S238N-H82]EDR02901.1 predicted protein [Laccaria bicolor S238N-H82]|eukprot:XP_001886611.1 predicted protein [Laccaria bicolor S238N-H82]
MCEGGDCKRSTVVWTPNIYVAPWSVRADGYISDSAQMMASIESSPRGLIFGFASGLWTIEAYLSLKRGRSKSLTQDRTDKKGPNRVLFGAEQDKMTYAHSTQSRLLFQQDPSRELEYFDTKKHRFDTYDQLSTHFCQSVMGLSLEDEDSYDGSVILTNPS